MKDDEHQKDKRLAFEKFKTTKIPEDKRKRRFGDLKMNDPKLISAFVNFVVEQGNAIWYLDADFKEIPDIAEGIRIKSRAQLTLIVNIFVKEVLGREEN